MLEEVHAKHPNDREVLYALVTFNRDRGNLAAARHYAEKLLTLAPQDTAAHQLLEQLQGR